VTAGTYKGKIMTVVGTTAKMVRLLGYNVLIPALRLVWASRYS
jgi:hypothetical protein